MLLFYALSQAGRAIASAHHEAGGRVAGHGLAEACLTEPVPRSMIRREGRRPGLFGAMADLNQAELSSEVELGALWAALPRDSVPSELRNWPPAMRVWLPGLYSSDPLERKMAHLRHFAIIVPPFELENPDELLGLLENYPAATNARPNIVQGLWPIESTPFGYGYRFYWNWDVEPSAGMSRLVAQLPQHRFRQEHWLIPAVGAKRQKLPPFLLWWVLLFGLSLLARYKPAEWVAALDPDTSTLAVPLENLLDDALESLPHLILEELHRRKIVVDRS